MYKNRIQFQKGLSLSKFMDNPGTEAQNEASLEADKWPNGFYVAIVSTILFHDRQEVLQNASAICVNIKFLWWLALFGASR